MKYFVETLLLMVLICAVSCTRKENFQPRPGAAVFAIVGEPVQVRLGIAVSGLSVGVATRTEEPVSDYDGEDSEEERHVDDLWMFEYSSASGELIYPPQRVTIDRQEELSDISVTLSNNFGRPVIVYVVANSAAALRRTARTGWLGQMWGAMYRIPDL